MKPYSTENRSERKERFIMNEEYNRNQSSDPEQQGSAPQPEQQYAYWQQPAEPAAPRDSLW